MLILPLVDKFFGLVFLNKIVLFPTLISLGEPSVRYTALVGTCVDSPSLFWACTPVGMMRALSLFAMAIATSSAVGVNSPSSLLILGFT